MPIISKLARGFVLFISKVTTRVKPAKLPPQSQPREPAKNHRDSVAWAQETLANRDVSDTYTQVQLGFYFQYRQADPKFAAILDIKEDDQWRRVQSQNRGPSLCSI